MTDPLAKYEEASWKEVPTDVQKLCEALGYTQQLWDNDKEPPACKKYFSNLSSSELAAAKALGYTQETWDADSESESSDSE
mmetsp:Transcript_20493/g.44595  ORF Transcript_20493/g.44595 Transcript_20493/m.44595 type:complete len:81 (+) Transcript_20493:130-372(+)|eukprot:CAMPEP_0168169230 /NCGR_PEP_ID=MMETSP0139_2-20121125/3529_1 /TAXON_ID=44445 /ORGANISM="Pseudo-nitzschia australis, Strain 10249 10 AB" /LENGTH=80 /DNA_ID=CAMNT_0008086639 /DNA_START=121 /DNA_END=363 /DNA_ORIENTATION=+